MNIIGIDKFQFVRKHVKENALKSILDVGCRDCKLKDYVADVVEQYKGCDLFQNEANSVDYVLNFENGLPLDDNSFDCVTALDLIEHLDGFQEGLEESLRVTKKELVIMLPNVGHLLSRLKFLFFEKISEKYSLNTSTCTKGSDRHRWLTIFSETNKYMEEFSKKRGLMLKRYNYIGNGSKMMFIARLGKFLRLPESLYVWSMIYIIKKI